MIRLANVISRIEKHIRKLKELEDSDLSNEVVFNALAMHCFQTVNAVIELGEIIITERKLGFPAKYREIFELIYKAKIIEKGVFEDLKRLIFLRNLIAHEYYAIKEEELKEMMELLDSVDVLVKVVKKEIRK